MANSLDGIPIAFAFVLGIVGALAPCQFVGNIRAITLYGNRSLQRKIVWKDVFGFIFGKVVAFSLLGLLIWVFGREIEGYLTIYFPWMRKLMGPLLIVVGLVMLGLIKPKWSLKLFELTKNGKRENPFGSFLLGFSFSLAFCPTMFVLYFISLMPVVLSSSYGVILPTLFALGTVLPLLATIFLMWYLGGSGVLLKKGRKLGTLIQRIAGVFMTFVGIIDSITYWL
ncbi:sulfite exporter TauE/SafE family protein [Metabacillus sediminilitoris]|uniref:Sulfite exporter TauE/SafE family protein n=1 Tax=Metabacillus sediminilitoris TaxID=2567941 RepID=A0A4S4C3A5_9BACI|nr:sulfite exporter TauE/SafE family protein [Metabacillus sediminilitoris]QGQ44464.1 sulfite exporter TauE/SafE family protein [Metabacillus sediminilitoris]THF80087.1 sulfite exporter TauE/SafE family protein [Metabacillus sediminilitoris]